MGCNASITRHQHEMVMAKKSSMAAEKAANERIKELCSLDSNKAIRIREGERVTFANKDRVVVSFPGVHGYAWNYLMENCNQMDGIKTSCVFLPDESSSSYGQHTAAEGSCACNQLYGGVLQPWGCKWYDLWKNKTDRAVRKGCELYAVCKMDKSFGRSQKGEIRYLRNMRYDFKILNVEQFTEMVWEPVLAPLREMRSISLSTDMRAINSGSDKEGIPLPPPNFDMASSGNFLEPPPPQFGSSGGAGRATTPGRASTPVGGRPSTPRGGANTPRGPATPRGPPTPQKPSTPRTPRGAVTPRGPGSARPLTPRSEPVGRLAREPSSKDASQGDAAGTRPTTPPALQRKSEPAPSSTAKTSKFERTTGKPGSLFGNRAGFARSPSGAIP